MQSWGKFGRIVGWGRLAPPPTGISWTHPWFWYPSQNTEHRAFVFGEKITKEAWMPSHVSYYQGCVSIGGSKGVPGTPPPRGPNSFIFLQFSAKNLQNNRLAHPLWELAHTKSWNRHCQCWYHTCGTFVTTTLQPTPHSLLQLSPLHNNTQPTIYIPLHTTHTQCEGDRQLSESVRVTHITAV